jgi:hypothetical protein
VRRCLVSLCKSARGVAAGHLCGKRLPLHVSAPNPGLAHPVFHDPPPHLPNTTSLAGLGGHSTALSRPGVLSPRRRRGQTRISRHLSCTMNLNEQRGNKRGLSCQKMVTGSVLKWQASGKTSALVEPKGMWSSSPVLARCYLVNQKYICDHMNYKYTVFTCAGVLQMQYLKLSSIAGLGTMENSYTWQGMCTLVRPW